MKFTYLIPHASSEEIFAVCKDAISKHTPAEILVSPKEQFGNWHEAISWLWDNCPTDIGVFLDDDCMLLNDITPLIEQAPCGVEGIIPFSKGGLLRNSPGYYDMTFMAINIKEFNQRFGRDAILTDMVKARKEIEAGRSIEHFYGVSQHLRDEFRTLRARLSNYGLATVYEDTSTKATPYMIHLWYGSWKHRHAENEVDAKEMQEREDKFIKDYWANTLRV